MEEVGLRTLKTTVVMKKEIFKPSGRTAGYRFALLNVL
jgi:hypothetical protein